MLVVFRTDASIQIGTGHVMRCLTLADELTRQGHECRFICREHPGHLGDVIISKGYSLTLLPAPVDTHPLQKISASDDYASWLGVTWQEDANQTRHAISTLNPDWLVVDHYGLDAQWERTLSGKERKIFVIDDLANRSHECNLLLDDNLGRSKTDYDSLLLNECQRLIGPDFALIRPEFLALREQSLLRRKIPKLNRILISLGGVDSSNLTGQILEAIEKSSVATSTELDVIMGVSAPHIDAVQYQAAHSRFSVTVNVNVMDMAERMSSADLAIGSAGGTTWERCCLGLPSIITVVADNQISVSNALKKQRIAIVENGVDNIIDELEKMSCNKYRAEVFEELISLSSSLVTGNGCCKVVEKLSEYDG